GIKFLIILSILLFELPKKMLYNINGSNLKAKRERKKKAGGGGGGGGQTAGYIVSCFSQVLPMGFEYFLKKITLLLHLHPQIGLCILYILGWTFSLFTFLAFNLEDGLCCLLLLFVWKNHFMLIGNGLLSFPFFLLMGLLGGHTAKDEDVSLTSDLTSESTHECVRLGIWTTRGGNGLGQNSAVSVHFLENGLMQMAFLKMQGPHLIKSGDVTKDDTAVDASEDRIFATGQGMFASNPAKRPKDQRQPEMMGSERSNSADPSDQYTESNGDAELGTQGRLLLYCHIVDIL
ncbi:hypothetical protein ACJX0J_024020, partial [Zea mays]